MADSCFPSTRIEALAMLYLQSQDLSNKTPAEIQTLYYETYRALQDDHREKSKSGFFSRLKES